MEWQEKRLEMEINHEGLLGHVRNFGLFPLPDEENQRIVIDWHTG